MNIGLNPISRQKDLFVNVFDHGLQEQCMSAPEWTKLAARANIAHLNCPEILYYMFRFICASMLHQDFHQTVPKHNQLTIGDKHKKTGYALHYLSQKVLPQASYTSFLVKKNDNLTNK